MADIQRYFIEFHDRIRLDPFDENEDLRDKRDMLIGELKDKLPMDVPTFRHFNQGSYAMNTGTRPKDGNYDIDVGIVFACKKDKYPDPVTLKRHVLKALEHGNRTVRIRRPCVTVEYLRDGKVDYHVDLAIYVERLDAVGLDLAVGAARHKDDDAAQMRRSIRYLKRWRDHCFNGGKGPISVALTVAAYRWFMPSIDLFSKKAVDSKALKNLVDTILANFQWTVDKDGQMVERLSISLPVAPHCDLLADVSQSDMATIKARLVTFASKLQQAIDEPLPETACAILVSQFGDEFPTPTPRQTAKVVSAPYVHTGQSA
jgi:cyclic GMP-AMP synthase DncV-like protein